MSLSESAAQALFAEANKSYAAGDLAAADRALERLLAAQPRLLPALHLGAIVARRLGRTGQAQARFDAALALAPGDPDLLNGAANLAMDMGQPAVARQRYEAALDRRPGHVETLVNLAAALRALGDAAEARQALEAAVRTQPVNLRALLSLAALAVAEGEFDEAAALYDRALAIQPASLLALRGRALVEAEVGGDAAPLYARARAVAPQDPLLALEAAQASLKAGDLEAARRDLEALVAAQPDFAPAHEALSRLRWAAGEDERFTESFERTLAADPGQPALWLGYFGALMRSGRPERVLAELGRAEGALGALAVSLEAAAAAQAGDPGRAERAFARTDPMADPGLRLAWLGHLLRTGRPEAAAAQAERAARELGDSAAWPYAAVAWRLLGDPQWAWLEGDPAFVRSFDLPFSAAELTALGEVLRGLHRARQAPFDQTLRRGTQTEGALLSRREPEIRALRRKLAEAVGEYVVRLPLGDHDHPLLGPSRTGWRFAGSWSVRLTQEGFHVNHVHTTGWISSAFYVALPETIGASPADPAGWLTLGEPPVELGLSLDPIRMIEPRPGRLALFPSTMWHGTRPFGTGERLTAAFDIAPR